MADLYDALNQNTRACGNWGKKGPPKFDPWPRPKSKAKAKHAKAKPVSVKDIFNRFRR